MYRPSNVNTTSSTLWDLQAMYQAESIALTMMTPGERSGIQSRNSLGTNSSAVSCAKVPFLEMELLKVVVDDLGLTRVHNSSTAVQPMYEAIHWTGGNHNGSYPLGEEVIGVFIGV